MTSNASAKKKMFSRLMFRGLRSTWPTHVGPVQVVRTLLASRATLRRVVAHPDPLDSAVSKLRWAEQHLIRLKAAVDDFLSLEPYGTIHEVGPDEMEHLFRLSVRQEPPVDLALMAGDLIQNLRAVLDHMVFALAEVEAQRVAAVYTDQQIRKIQFPIVEEPASLVKNVKGGWLGVRQSGAFLDPLQPYIGRNAPLFLGHLRELSNIDKHRRLHVLAHSTRQGSVDGTGLNGHTVRWNKGPLEQGAEVARITLAKPSPHVDVKVSFGLSFEPIGRGKHWASTEAIGFRQPLESIYHFINTDVLNAFNKELR